MTLTTIMVVQAEDRTDLTTITAIATVIVDLTASEMGVITIINPDIKEETMIGLKKLRMITQAAQELGTRDLLLSTLMSIKTTLMRNLVAIGLETILPDNQMVTTHLISLLMFQL
jgi:hypothetical protein